MPSVCLYYVILQNSIIPISIHKLQISSRISMGNLYFFHVIWLFADITPRLAHYTLPPIHTASLHISTLYTNTPTHCIPTHQSHLLHYHPYTPVTPYRQPFLYTASVYTNYTLYTTTPTHCIPTHQSHLIHYHHYTLHLYTPVTPYTLPLLHTASLYTCHSCSHISLMYCILSFTI